MSRAARWAGAVGSAAAVWVTVGLAGLVFADVVLFVLHGWRTSLPVWWAVRWPLGVLAHPLDPAQAYGPYASVMRVPAYVVMVLAPFVVAGLVVWRKGLWERRKDQARLPLSRRARPRAVVLGIWPQGRAPHLLQRAMARLTEGKSQGGALYRSNGMMVDAAGPQPADRILLGYTDYVHFLRRKRYYVYARGDHHVAVFGPSGTGKGVSQMNPSMLFWNGVPAPGTDGFGAGWPGPLITSTVKNDHVDVSLEWRASLSEQCWVYDPLQLYPEFSDYWVGWNPIGSVRTATEANAVAQALMEAETQQTTSKSGNDEYFTSQALMVLGPMMLAASIAKKPFRAVYEWALSLEGEASDDSVVSESGEVSPDSTMYEVLAPLYDYADATGDRVPINQVEQLFGKDPREASGVWGTVRKALLPYNDETSVKSTSGETIRRLLDPREFYASPNATLFIIAPEVANEAKRMRPVFAAFITWLIEQAQMLARENQGKLPLKVLANLDEVKNVGAIPGLAHTLSLTRSAGFFVKHAWQDQAQIESAYGKDDAKTIVSNSRSWVVLPGMSDPEHLETVGKLIGEQRVAKRSKSRNAGSWFSSSSSLSREQQRVADAAAIKQLRDDELLVVADNLSPFVIKQARYYEDPVMLARSELGAPRRAARG